MATETSHRSLPNIVITGTPGTGKSSHAQALVDACPLPLRNINVVDLVKEKDLHDGYDADWQTYIVDEDRVIDELEPLAEAGGLVLDWHTCDAYPERWIDLVVVLQCNHTILWERLEARDYPLKKIQENNQCEIMETVLSEAREAYAEEIVIPLQSEKIEDMDSNVSRIIEWINAWRANKESSE